MSLGSLDAVVLAGGLGTRLQSILGDGLPKPLASIRGRPFLDILVDSLVSQGISRIIMCVSHRRELVIEHCRRRSDVNFVFSEEQEPLGTGGAIRQAATWVQSDPFLAMNGDSFCAVDFRAFRSFHASKGAPLSIVLTSSCGRVDGGTVDLAEDGRVTAFREKAGTGALISAGIYLVSRRLPATWLMPAPFSIEKSVIPDLAERGQCYGYKVEAELTDIGTPRRYHEAQTRL